MLQVISVFHEHFIYSLVFIPETWKWICLCHISKFMKPKSLWKSDIQKDGKNFSYYWTQINFSTWSGHVGRATLVGPRWQHVECDPSKRPAKC